MNKALIVLLVPLLLLTAGCVKPEEPDRYGKLQESADAIGEMADEKIEAPDTDLLDETTPVLDSGALPGEDSEEADSEGDLADRLKQSVEGLDELADDALVADEPSLIDTETPQLGGGELT